MKTRTRGDTEEALQSVTKQIVKGYKSDKFPCSAHLPKANRTSGSITTYLLLKEQKKSILIA
jgi:hypothetical protein